MSAHILKARIVQVPVASGGGPSCTPFRPAMGETPSLRPGHLKNGGQQDPVSPDFVGENRLGSRAHVQKGGGGAVLSAWHQSLLPSSHYKSNVHITEADTWWGLHRAWQAPASFPCHVRRASLWSASGWQGKGPTHSIGNQSLHRSFTVSRSSWHSKRRLTSLRALGGTASVIHTCRGQQ